MRVFLLACLDCDDDEPLVMMPFISAAERGGWAADHTAGTGHNRWWAFDGVVADEGALDVGLT